MFVLLLFLLFLEYQTSDGYLVEINQENRMLNITPCLTCLLSKSGMAKRLCKTPPEAVKIKQNKRENEKKRNLR